MKNLWKECKLGDAINLKRGFDLPSSKRIDGAYPILSSSGISGWHNEYQSSGPGVVTGRYGTIGQVFYVENEYWPLNTTLYVQDFKGNLPKFVYYFLKTFNFHKYNDKSTVPGINRNHLHEEIISIPDLLTQTAIAEILSSLDDKIELNNQINQEFKALAQALFKQWFIHFEFPNENGQPYKSSGGEMVESELGEIPKGWTTEILSEVSQLIRGISYSRDELVSSDEGVPFVNLKCFALDGTFRQDGLKYYNGKYKPEQLVSSDDILVAVTDLTQARDIIGMPLLWKSNEIAVPSLDTCLVRPKHPLLTSYLYYEFKTFRYKSRIIEFANGSTVLHLSIKGLQTYLLPMPQRFIITKWNDLANPIIAHINSNIREINELSELRDTLLPKLISGELKISEPKVSIVK